MSFFSLLAVFILEQIQPLAYRRFVRNPVNALAALVARRCNAGEYRHGMLATLAVLLPLLGILLGIYWVLSAINPVLAWVMNVVVLYLTMGFRQFSHHYTEILLALRHEDLPLARQLLADWRYANGRAQPEHGGLEPSEEIARESIVLALLGAHRHVFAVLLWFVLLPGPLGAVLYRMTGLLADAWEQGEPLAERGQSSDFPVFARRLFVLLDWLPARATAAAFAIVGNFEDAVNCAREEFSDWTDEATGIVLASAAGALGVRLSTRVVVCGESVPEGMEEIGLPGPEQHETEAPFGETAGVDFMQSAVGLVWRATVLWVLLLFVLGLASFFG